MELIYTDRNYNELGYLKDFTLDLEVGKYGVSSNDFELTIPYGNYDSVFDTDSLLRRYWIWWNYWI